MWTTQRLNNVSTDRRLSDGVPRDLVVRHCGQLSVHEPVEVHTAVGHTDHPHLELAVVLLVLLLQLPFLVLLHDGVHGVEGAGGDVVAPLRLVSVDVERRRQLGVVDEWVGRQCHKLNLVVPGGFVDGEDVNILLTSWILNTDFSGFTVGHLDFFTYANYMLINFS